MYDFIDIKKEIEGHRRKTEFFSPLGLAVLTIFRYLYINPKIDKNLFVDMKKDINALKKSLKHKKIVIIGRGETGGKLGRESVDKCQNKFLFQPTPKPLIQQSITKRQISS